MSSKRSIQSYPRPSKPIELPVPFCPPAPFLPLRSPPKSDPPPLPSRPPITALSGWKRSEHALRAAYPRTFVETSGKLDRESEPHTQGSIPKDESKEARTQRATEELKRVTTARYYATRTQEGDVERPGLWIAAERWQREREGKGEGLVLVCTHANGFHKEAWFPTFRRLLTQSISPASFGDPTLPVSTPRSTGQDSLEIDEVWFLDDIHHGASIDLNAGLIGPVHNWVDGGRDVIAVIEQVVRRDRPEKKVIAVGHSVGGNAIVQAAHARPDLFDALFLVEPMCPPTKQTAETILQVSRNPLTFATMKRRAHWPSVAEAAKVRSTAFYSKWHEEAFEMHLSHGLVPIPRREGAESTGVQLATPKWAEAAVFAETEGLGIGWDKLAELKVPVGFVMAGDPRATMGEEVTGALVWRPAVSANERFMVAGHLVVHEKPDEVADAIRRFIGNALLGTPKTKDAKARL